MVKFTKRETQVLTGLLQEKKNHEIAKELNINEKSVGTYKLRLLQKTKTKTIIGLYFYNLQHKVVGSIKNEVDDNFDYTKVKTPDGLLSIVKQFGLQTENRKMSFIYLEDETLIINVQRFEESETSPYSERITNQVMRLSKLTTSLLMACLIKANIDFGLDFDAIIAELNVKRANEPNSECIVCGEEYLNPEKDSDTCLDCRNK
jgi:DNA-binding CsgD family transcriptional regulator